jgi:hypothetical protein
VQESSARPLVARGEGDGSLTPNPSRFAPKHKWHATTLRSEPAIPATAPDLLRDGVNERPCNAKTVFGLTRISLIPE